MLGRKSFRTCGTISANWQRRFARLSSAGSPNAGARYSFLEQVPKWYVFSRARFHQFVVGAEDAAESDVMKIGGVTFSPSNRENLFEVQNLGGTHHVPNGIGL